jgi:uncharacterized repeat protein (TIGR01451 family)
MSRRSGYRVACVVLLVAFLFGFAYPGEAGESGIGTPGLLLDQDRSYAQVEPQLWRELTERERTDFFIWLREKADLSGAALLGTKAEKGAFVYQALHSTAKRTQRDLRAELERRGLSYRTFYIANKILVRGGDQRLVFDLAARPEVEQITANRTIQLDVPIAPYGPMAVSTDVEENLSFINADDVWALGYTGQGVVLAANDTGLDETHPAIASHYRGCLNPPTCSAWNHNYNWWDATGTYPTNPYDGYSHGTFVTGILVGDDGGANQIGVAPGAQAVHCKNMRDDGSGNQATFSECFEWDLAPWDLNGENPRPDLAPDVVNNSWGFYNGGVNYFKDEIAALQAAGILVEASAGNDGPNCSTIDSPGDYGEVLTTGAVHHKGLSLPGTLWNYSSRGPSPLDSTPPHYFPDVMAPGVSVRSSLPGTGYAPWNGTSFSGPHVSGLVALMWEANPALHGNITRTVELIQDTAVPLSGVTGSNCGGDYTDGPNNDWGFGTIDALAAVQAALAVGGTGVLQGEITEAGASRTSGDPVYEAEITASKSLTLTWRTFSDEQGDYTLKLPGGTYTVSVGAYGYQAAQILGVEVFSGTIMALDIELDPSSTHVVSGTVRDADHGFPLYANLIIEGDPYDPCPCDDLWTDPLSGVYSLTLAEDISYTFKVQAQGYSSQSRAVGPFIGDRTEDFNLGPDYTQGCPPGYTTTPIFYDGFEAGVLGPLWTIVTTTHGRVQVSANNPYSGTYAVHLDASPNGGSYSFASIVITQDLSAYMEPGLSFWWFDANDENHEEDGVFISDDGVSWHRVVSFNDGDISYLPAYVNLGIAAADLGLDLNDHFQVKFQFYDNLSIPNDGYLIDEVRLYECTVQPSGRVVGAVYDQNTGSPLSGALVESDTGTSAVTDAQGLYQLIEANGIHTLTGTVPSLPESYGNEIQVVSVTLGATAWQDFYLPAPIIEVSPQVLEAWVLTGTLVYTDSDGLLVTNHGGHDLACEFSERGPGGSAVIPWVLEQPVSGTVPLSATQGIDLVYTAVVTDPLPLGVYTGTLMVASSDPVVPTTTVPITLHVYQLPQAAFEATTPVCLGESMVFTNTTVQGKPPETTYTWDFDDGITSPLEAPNHEYTAAGTYSVTLEACNAGGCDQATRLVMVRPLCTAGFIYATNGLTVTFTNTSIHADHFLWDFGDEITSTLEHPVHAYTQHGVYTATLVADNDCGENIYIDTVRVQLGADLVLSKRVQPLAASPGDTITYTLAFTNNGTEIATGVVLTDLVPVSLTVVITRGWGTTLTLQPGEQFVWRVSDLEIGHHAGITLTGVLSDSLVPGTVLVNRAEIHTEGEIVPGDNWAEASLLIAKRVHRAFFPQVFYVWDSSRMR